MKAVETKLLPFLKKSSQFIIPIYQRTYSWTARECEQLWNDIIRSGTTDKIITHFMGSVVYVEQGLSQVSVQSPLLVIDGQQRLTTISILLEALARRIGDKEIMDGFSARKLRNYYLQNAEESGDRQFKLILTQTDKDTLLALLQNRPFPKECSLRINDSFEFFKNKIDSLGEDLIPLCNGISKLAIVDIALTRDQDNPQLIFESMNSTGKELSQADLIRNYILMGLPPDIQTKLYQDHWRPMEVEFGQQAYGEQFDGFMRHYLTVKTGDIPNVNRVYEEFKKYSQTKDVITAGVEKLVADIHDFASYFCAFALGKEKDKELGEAFRDIRELRVEVSYPFLLRLYSDYRSGLLKQHELLEIIRITESYVFRRAICGIPTNSLNKTFANFGASIQPERYLESVKAHFVLLPSYRRFPGDEEFKRQLSVKEVFGSRICKYFLRRLENKDRKEPVSVEEYTIEHIMPQNENMPDEWKKELGPEWERIQKTWLHTIGNLTLTGYNSEYSDNSFAKKRDMKGGFKQSPLKLNEGLGNLDKWDEKSIQERGAMLADSSLKVWQAPVAEGINLDLFTAKTEKVDNWSITDHQHLSDTSAMRPIFEAFRKEVLAIDKCVVEEFKKLYVAYKAETNFVDVVPQAKCLRLALNIDFHEINDPKGLCKDVTDVGRWGNGDTEVKLSSMDQLPYVIGLVRQAFERQMGNGDSAI
jgi:uncharacterized protein with ParB-like and HNH nuclease domain/predicted transport protein